MGRLIIDGNSVYEIDEECMRRKERGAELSKTETDDEICAKKPSLKERKEP